MQALILVAESDGPTMLARIGVMRALTRHVGLNEDPKFRVRETPEWKLHAADLEAEMLKRGMLFEVIDWDEGQAKLPFDE